MFTCKVFTKYNSRNTIHFPLSDVEIWPTWQFSKRIITDRIERDDPLFIDLWDCLYLSRRRRSVRARKKTLSRLFVMNQPHNHKQAIRGVRELLKSEQI